MSGVPNLFGVLRLTERRLVRAIPQQVADSEATLIEVTVAYSLAGHHEPAGGWTHWQRCLRPL